MKSSKLFFNGRNYARLTGSCILYNLRRSNRGLGMKITVTETCRQFPCFLKKVQKNSTTTIKMTVRDEIVAELRTPKPVSEEPNKAAKNVRSSQEAGSPRPRSSTILYFQACERVVWAGGGRSFRRNAFFVIPAFYDALAHSDRHYDRAGELLQECRRANTRMCSTLGRHPPPLLVIRRGLSSTRPHGYSITDHSERFRAEGAPLMCIFPFLNLAIVDPHYPVH